MKWRVSSYRDSSAPISNGRRWCLQIVLDKGSSVSGDASILTAMSAKAQRSMKVVARCQVIRGFASDIGYEERSMRHNWGENGLMELPRDCKSPVTDTKPGVSKTLEGSRTFGDTLGCFAAPQAPPFVVRNSTAPHRSLS